MPDAKALGPVPFRAMPAYFQALATIARAQFPRLCTWIERHAEERSTYIGLALVATDLGFPSVAEHLTGLSVIAPTLLTTIGAALAAASTKPRPPELLIVASAPAPPSAAPPPPTPLLPPSNPAVTNEEEAAATGVGGFVKLGNVVTDLAKIAEDKGIKADFMVLTVVAAKAYAQVKADAPALLDVAIEHRRGDVASGGRPRRPGRRRRGREPHRAGNRSRVMRVATVVQASTLGEMPDQDARSEPVVRVLTSLPTGEPNAFYMDPADRAGVQVGALPKTGDPVTFDQQDGLHKVVTWAGRHFRQREASFDWLARG